MANISGPDFITILVSDLKASYNFYKEKIGLSESAEKRPNAHATDWQFVEAWDVPPGPWRSYGENNHFVIARRQTEQRLKEQKGK